MEEIVSGTLKMFRETEKMIYKRVNDEDLSKNLITNH